jgi:type II secretory pathway pseudopilin PulG
MKRFAFTLVELLVTVAVIILLVAILIPAVNMAREAARRAQCVTRQRNLAIAMITYNNDNNGLPGYLNELAATPVHSWAVSVFPMIAETKRYEVLMTGEPVPTDAFAPLPALICPSDHPLEDKRLNYVVNCGPVEDTGMDDTVLAVVRSLSLFKDHRFVTVSSEKKKLNTKVKIEEIPDGASNTILLSENADAGVDTEWYADWSLFPLNSSGKPTRNEDAVNQLGFLWSPLQEYFPNSSVPGPRPSSKHPGTVVAAYADGSAKPLNDDISIDDWLKAVCPNDAKLGEL